MTRTPFEQTIAADPTSTALLVAAVACAPRSATGGLVALVERTLRTDDSFVTRFVLGIGGAADVTGVLTLVPEPGPGVIAWTRASVHFDAPMRDTSTRAVVSRLLQDLGRAAEQRAFAA